MCTHGTPELPELVVENLIELSYEYARTGRLAFLHLIRSVAGTADGPVFVLLAEALAVALREQNVSLVQITRGLQDGFTFGVRVMENQQARQIVTTNNYGTMTGVTVAVAVESEIANCSTVVNSLPQSDLKEALHCLTSISKDFVSKLPENLQNTALRALSTFVQESSATKPNLDWLRLSVEGIADAAKVLGVIADPVISIVNKILDLMGFAELRR
jgi:hypothetical protein